jgi:hypothetical protein
VRVLALGQPCACAAVQGVVQQRKCCQMQAHHVPSARLLKPVQVRQQQGRMLR